MAKGSVLREADGKRAFDALKPVCVRVMSSPSLDNLGELREKVRGLPVAIHPHLLDYVLLPVRVLFKRCGSDLRLVESGLQTLSTVFSRVDGVESWAVVQELVIYICTVLDPNVEKEATGFVDLSEDVVLAAVEALRAMLLSLTPSVRLKLLSELPLVGHCVSVLLALLQSYEAKKLRREVLSAMLALSGVDATSLSNLIGNSKPTNQSGGKDDDITEADSEGKSSDAHDPSHILTVLTKYVGVSECAEMGGVFASFLPGITIALTKVMTSDVKVGSSVSVLALLTWAHYVAMVMDDAAINAAETGVGVADKKEGAEPQLWPLRRTRSWYSETDEKLSVLVQRVCVLVTSEGWRVRLGMVGWAHTILTHCHKSLVKCMPAVLEILVSLSHDDYPLISSTAKLALTSFTDRYSKEEEGEGAGLRAIMEERLHSLSSSLPRLLRSQSEAGKVSTLQLLTGYLELLQSRVTNLVNSQPHLTRIIQALVLTMEIEVSDVHIVEHQSATNLPGNPPEGSTHHHQPLPLPPQPSLHFVHFTSDRISSLLQQVCELLGRHGSLTVIIDHLLEKLRLSPSTHGKELLLILSHVLLGAASRRESEKGRESAESADKIFVLVEGLLEELVAPGNWDRSWPAALNFDTGGGESFWREEGVTSTKDTCLYSCLQLHVVSMCVHLLSSAFKPLLQTVVYPLLQRLGNEHVSIATTAHATLKYTAAHCGYKTLSELITDNADYLVNSVALHLRGPAHLQALQVLQAVVSHSDESVLPLVQDSIDELFLSLDVRQIEPSLVWPVLRTLAQSCERWRTVPKTTPNPSTPPPASSSSSNTHGTLTESSREKEGGASHVISDESHVTNYDSDGGSHVTPEAVEEFFLQYHKEKQRREEEGEFSESELNECASKEDSHGGGGENEEEDPYNQRRELSPLSRTAVEVMQRCSHHMSTEPPSLRLVVLDTLSHSILALQHEQNTLLPEVHNIWSPFLPRLSDSAPPVARRAWQVMVVLCDVCREFLRKRVVQGVWSSLVHCLESLTPRSRNTDKLYKQTAQCKLQQELLECVGVLSLKLQVSTANLERLAHACAPYLASDQPDILQQACLTCFQNLIDLDPDTMWLLLEQLRSEGGGTTPPSSALKPYKLPSCPDRDKYRDNVNILIHRT